MREKSNQNMLRQFTHRLYALKAKEFLLMTLQIVGITICTLYVLANFFHVQINDKYIIMGRYLILFKANHFSLLCFILAILLALPRPANLREQINTLRLAIRYLKLEKDLQNVDSNKMVIQQAIAYTTEVDSAYAKRKTGYSDQIEPHEKRMVVRKWMIVLGIPGISILSAILVFVCGWNIPQIASIDLLLGYSLVMIEAYYYQLALKKAKIDLMSDNYKSCIIDISNLDLTKKRKIDILVQEFKLYQKICHMRADRYLNYCLVLHVASSATNILSIIITILDQTKSVEFQKLFALEASRVNEWVALLFMLISIIFYGIDFFFRGKIDLCIIELKADEKMQYTNANYNYLNNKVKEWYKIKDIFSHNALDIGRGLYDFNNDILVEKYFGKKDVFIPASCVFTVEQAFPGKVPRYKLTAFIFWLCSFCCFVWGGRNYDYIFSISIIAVAIYDALLIVNAIRLWVLKSDWLDYEKELERHNKFNLVRDVRWDFYKKLITHSIFVFILVSLSLLYRNGNRANVILVSGAIVFTLSSFGGYLGLYKQKVIKVFGCYNSWWAIYTLALGVLFNIVCFIYDRNMPNSFCILLLVIGLPMLIEILGVYCKKIQLSNENAHCSIPICETLLIINWSITFIFVCYNDAIKLWAFTDLILLIYIISITVLIYSMIKLLINQKNKQVE